VGGKKTPKESLLIPYPELTLIKYLRSKRPGADPPTVCGRRRLRPNCLKKPIV
jgi:hypothetical protein